MTTTSLPSRPHHWLSAVPETDGAVTLLGDSLGEAMAHRRRYHPWATGFPQHDPSSCWCTGAVRLPGQDDASGAGTE